MPLVSPRAAGGRELTLTPCRPGDARGHVRPCRAGDTPPPSLWPASRPPSGGREGEPGSGGLPTGPVPRLPPLPPGPLPRPPGLAQHPPPGAGREGHAASVCDEHGAAVAGVHPESGTSRWQTAGARARQPVGPPAPLFLGPWPHVAPPMPAPLGLSLPAGCFWPVGPDPQGWPHPSRFPGTKLWRSSGPPAAPGPSEAPPGSPWARPASGTARGQSGDPGPSGSPDAWLGEAHLGQWGAETLGGDGGVDRT